MSFKIIWMNKKRGLMFEHKSCPHVYMTTEKKSQWKFCQVDSKWEMFHNRNWAFYRFFFAVFLLNKAGYTGQDGAPALLIPRPIPSSIRPIPSSIDLSVDEYDNEWNDKKHEFLDLSRALSDLSRALSDLSQALLT